jgi:hypothetical protein
MYAQLSIYIQTICTVGAYKSSLFDQLVRYFGAAGY